MPAGIFFFSLGLICWSVTLGLTESVTLSRNKAKPGERVLSCWEAPSATAGLQASPVALLLLCFTQRCRPGAWAGWSWGRQRGMLRHWMLEQ